MRRRTYYTHDPHPPTLIAEVRPADVPYLATARAYAVWSDTLQVGWLAGAAHVVAGDEHRGRQIL